MNLLITGHCNRSCPYCFANSKIELDTNPDEIALSKKTVSLDTVDWYLDFLENSNNKVFKILGGEPTLHPQLPTIVAQALDRDFEAVIFTNGLWPKQIRHYFEENTDNRVSFVVNLNEPLQQQQWENDRQKECLKIAGTRAMIGFNIFQEKFNLLFCKDLINEFSLRREIRLGLASPIVRENNVFLSNSSLKLIGKRLCHQLRELEANDILGAFDCGFPLCMFEESDLGSLAITTTKGFNSICHPIIDVDADLNAWPCFPLSKLLNVNLRDFKSYQELFKDPRFTGIFRIIRNKSYRTAIVNLKETLYY